MATAKNRPKEAPSQAGKHVKLMFIVGIVLLMAGLAAQSHTIALTGAVLLVIGMTKMRHEI